MYSISTLHFVQFHIINDQFQNILEKVHEMPLFRSPSRNLPKGAVDDFQGGHRWVFLVLGPYCFDAKATRTLC
jgi:hypothetical protein